MGALVLLRNPLAPHTREIHPLAVGTPVIDWLQKHYPAGFGMPVRFYLNGDEKDLSDLDTPVGDDDVAVIALMPAVPAALLTTIAINLAIAAVLAAASFAVNYFFLRPTERSGKKGDQSSIYSVSADQNAARLGEPIPVIYGNVLTTPDYVAQPYTFFAFDQSSYNDLYSGIQYLDMLLCVGQGNVDVTEVYFGDTNVANLGGAVTYRVFKPADHRSTFGVIQSSMGGGFIENMITSPEVSNQEFVEAGDTAGPFLTCPPGQRGSGFQIDIVFPGGQTNPNSTGDVKGRQTQFTVSYWPVDDNGTAIGGSTNVSIICATTSGPTAVTGPNLTTIYTPSASAENRTIISSPLRRTYNFAVGGSGRWAVQITRGSAAPNAKNGTDRFIWTGLKQFTYGTGSAIYGDVTLMAVRIRASKGLGPDASARIKVQAYRRLPAWYGGAERRTALPPDAFADVYCNTVYGAARPRTEIDNTAMTAIYNKTLSNYPFNHVFRERITVWEALRTIMTPIAAEPLPLGSVMSAVMDGVKPRTALFTDANIVAGSMTVSYSFDNDSDPYAVEIEYVDPTDFKPVYVQYPAGLTAIPQRYSLPGVTSLTHASQFARLTWNRNNIQRKRITFDTELEGLLLLPGDRIGVSHNAVKWGDGGQVIAVSGAGNRTLTVDHDLNWSGGAKQMILRTHYGPITNPLTVTRGTKDNIAILAADAPTPILVDSEYDYTMFAFGSSSNIVRDFVVTAIRPSGENIVTVEAVNYSTSVFTGAMSYLAS